MENSYKEEKKYIEAKRKVKQVKAFYVHVLVNIISTIIIVLVNVKFSPQYHWFWFAVIGIVFVTFIHWMLVFGVNMLGFGRSWEEKKIHEYLNKKK
ncbi:2TM domain-containing protein [Tenacibaculum tangerinum]|uniref:2TM domain-containing protein n=1 Tax=Tenacibaculum tangerinum TaxID=3038772 RepID=A0ABY8L369_9FLAO|nr:2TM domain-containing protein [Tenacibaculum tangerinum]WGH75820.1 2TM domain-containing protein [Tenacibaculum tangerinum]